MTTSLYCHLPWCTRRCPYCDFNTYALHRNLPESDYLLALERDLEAEYAWVGERELQSIFFGGGTPSLFSADAYARLLTAINHRFPIAEDCEISIEVNPESASLDKLIAYRAAGLNRLSIGVQSFNDEHLRSLSRQHDGNQAMDAIRAAVDANFTDINIDLMYGLPEQTPKTLSADLHQALQAAITHLSIYQLTIEKNTPFAKHPPRLPDEEKQIVFDQTLAETMDGSAFVHYEISAYAMAGKACRHNLHYWRYGDYLCLGAGAHGKVTLDGEVMRYQKERSPRRYMDADYQGSTRQQLKRIDAQEQILEFFINVMRLSEGFTAEQIPSMDHRRLAQWTHAQLESAIDYGWLQLSQPRYFPTQLGWRYLNEMLDLFVP